MKIFTAAETRAPLQFAQLVPALRAAFAGEAQVPPRQPLVRVARPPVALAAQSASV